jgi:hypothetical protein
MYVVGVLKFKGGIILTDSETGKDKVKLYKDGAGVSKGEALIIYFKPESVEMARSLLLITGLQSSGRKFTRRIHNSCDSGSFQLFCTTTIQKGETWRREI